MNKWEELALITFIACDFIVERPKNIKLLCSVYYSNIKVETNDILRRLFK